MTTPGPMRRRVLLFTKPLGTSRREYCFPRWKTVCPALGPFPPLAHMSGLSFRAR